MIAPFHNTMDFKTVCKILNHIGDIPHINQGHCIPKKHTEKKTKIASIKMSQL